MRFERLPKGIRFVKVLPGRKPGDEACLVECSHPDEFRVAMVKGVRVGEMVCMVCKSTELELPCLTIAQVAKQAREPFSAPQAELF